MKYVNSGHSFELAMTVSSPLPFLQSEATLAPHSPRPSSHPLSQSRAARNSLLTLHQASHEARCA